MATTLSQKTREILSDSRIRKLRRYYPFTITGTFVVLVAAGLFVAGVLNGNPYGVFIGMAAAVMPAVLGTVARLLARRYHESEIAWDPQGPVYAGLGRQYLTCTVAGPEAPRFFRIHCAARGFLDAGRTTKLGYFYDAPADESNRIQLPMEVPVCGVLNFDASFSVRDIFGLTVARFTEPTERDVTIQPQPLSDDKVLPLEAAGGYEETSRQKSLDEERYYMREYVPGDRSRDINWKASARLQQLVTRISPNTQEKAKLLTIFLRPFASQKRDSLESVVHLNYAKRWMLAFLRLVKQEFPEYHFRVYAGGPAELLETEQDIELFSRRIASVPFQGPDDRTAVEPDPSGTIIFTTIYDTTLAAFLAELSSKEVYVFSTTNADAESTATVRSVDVAILPHSGFIAVPWALYREGFFPGSKARTRTWPVDRSESIHLDEHSLAVHFRAHGG